MSSYLNIYAHGRHDEVVYIGCYSRSSKIYEVFRDNGITGTSNEICQPVTKSDIHYLMAAVDNEIEEKTNNKKKEEKNKDLIGSWNNSVEEKMTALTEINDMINWYEEEISMLTTVRNTLILFEDIMDLHYNKEDTTIYAGIDARKPRFNKDGTFITDENCYKNYNDDEDED